MRVKDLTLSLEQKLLLLSKVQPEAVDPEQDELVPEKIKDVNPTAADIVSVLKTHSLNNSYNGRRVSKCVTKFKRELDPSKVKPLQEKLQLYHSQLDQSDRLSSNQKHFHCNNSVSSSVLPAMSPKNLPTANEIEAPDRYVKVQSQQSNLRQRFRDNFMAL